MPGYVKGDSFGQTRVMKAASCPYGTNLTKRECDRIRQIDRSRARARVERRREQVYVVERVKRPAGCVGTLRAHKGAKNVVGAIARYNAREAWRIEIRTEFGTQFQDIKYATQKNIRCWDEGIFVRCEFSARACRAGS